MAVPPPPPPLPPNGAAQTQALPPGWQRYTSAEGRIYYANAQTGQSSYTPPLSLPAGFSNAIYAAAPVAPVQPVQQQPKAKRTAKAKEKHVIEGTPWLRITTADGTVFYNNTATKASSWTVPDEIAPKAALIEQKILADKRKAVKEEAARIQAEETAKARVQNDARQASAPEEDEEADEEAEQEEREEMTVEQLEELAALRAEMDAQRGAAKKRPAVEQKAGKRKKPKVVQSLEEVEDEEWQKEMAAEMAAEAEREETGDTAQPQRELIAQQRTTSKDDMTSEENKALFRSMLAEKDVNPFFPWETELPKFVNDPRYSAVRKVADRRDLFEEFCREKVREQRAAKKGVKQDPKASFRSLLVAEVTSTRAHWEDFKRAHKKDSRFRDFGRDDRERERLFKDWLRELGEVKRADAKKREEMFLELLRQQTELKPDSQWTDVKRLLAEDPRYEAVGSSSLREGLFNKHLAHLAKQALEPDQEAKRAQEKRDRQAASLREREEQVRQNRLAIERAAGQSRAEAGREEGERELRSLLIDSIRDHAVPWTEALPQLERDPRFQMGSLAPHEKRQLFDQHIEDLRAKRIDALEALFERHAPQLNTPFSDVFPVIASDSTISRLHISPEQVEHMFDSWQRRRRTLARSHFDELLNESAFLEFWGRTRAEAIDQQAEEQTRKVLAADEEETAVDQIDLRAMAANIDLKEIHAVLRHDSRFRTWDFDPDARDSWIRSHLEQMAAPQATVHQKAL